MNDHRHPHASDEALSSLVDGLDDEGARAHVASCPECAARLDAFERARGLVASAVEPVDDLTRRRLVGAALRSGSERSRQAQRRLTLLGVAALVALVVVAVPLLGGDGDEADQAATGAGGLGTEDIPGDAVVGSLGALDDPSVIRGALGAAQEHGATAGGSSGAGTGASGGGAVSGDSGDSGEAGRDAARRTSEQAEADAPLVEALPPSNAMLGDSRPPRAALRCLGTLETRPPGRIVLAGTGTFGGEKAVALAFRAGERVLAVVLARSDCRFLSTQSFDAP